MTLCTWCGQQSQSDIICDWCKRPLPTRTATGGRAEIEFLRDGDDDKPNYLGFGIVAACVAVVGVLLFFMLKGAGTSVSSSGGAESPRPSAPATNTPPQRVPQPVSFGGGRGSPSSPALPPRSPGGTPLGGGGNNPPPTGPAARASGNIPINANIPRLVTIQKATFSIVNLPGGSKQLVGKLDMKNGSDRNVIDYRVELVWGTQIFPVTPVEGRGNNVRTMEQRVMRPQKNGSAQVMSQTITKPPDGSPYSIRLQAWLDGDPGMSVDEYLIR
jgi:hypothetical protein